MKRNAQKLLFFRRAVPTWALSFLAAIGVFVFIFIVEEDIEAFPTGSASSLEAIKALWSFLTEPNPWTAMGFLLALFMLPVTLFLAVVLANRPGAMRITQLAQEATCDVLYSVSRVIALLSWLFLPSLLHGFTIIIAIPLVPGISFVCSFFSEFCVSEDTLLRTQRQNHDELDDLTKLEENLRAKATRSLGYTKQPNIPVLDSKGRCQTRTTVVILAIVVVCSVTIWASVGIICFPAVTGWPAILDALVITCLILVDMVISYFIVKTRVFDKSNVGLKIFAGCFNICLLIFIGFGLSVSGGQLRAWWVAIGMAVLPLLGFGVCHRRCGRWFICHYWHICVGQKERCRANIDDNDQMLALKESSPEPPPAVDQGIEDKNHVTIPTEVLERAGLAQTHTRPLLD